VGPARSGGKARWLLAAGLVVVLAVVLAGGSAFVALIILPRLGQTPREDEPTAQAPPSDQKDQKELVPMPLAKPEVAPNQKTPQPSAKPAVAPDQKTPQPSAKPIPPAPDLSVFDRLRREDIPQDRLKAAGKGDPAKAPKEIVAIYGDSGSKSPLKGFALHPNGKTLALGQHDPDRVKILTLATGKERVLPQPMGSPICYSHDGKILATHPSHGQPACLWDAATGTKLQVLADGAFFSVVFSLDDRQVLFGPAFKPLQRQWVTGRAELGAAPPPALEKADYPLGGLGISPDGNLLVIGRATDYESTFVQLWDLPSGKLLGRTNEKQRPLIAAVFSPDSKLLAQVHLYQIEVPVFSTATCKRRGAFKCTGVCDLTFHPTGNLAATGHHGGEIYLWDVATFANTRILHVRPPTSGSEHGGIRRVQFTPDGRHLLTLNGDGTVYVLRLAPPPM
jgi:WD40 repeat protein